MRLANGIIIDKEKIFSFSDIDSQVVASGEASIC